MASAQACAGLPATVFDAHSQTGSHLAPERLDFDPVLEGELASPEFSNRIARSLHRIDRRLHSEMVLPGAFPDASAITL